MKPTTALSLLALALVIASPACAPESAPSDPEPTSCPAVTHGPTIHDASPTADETWTAAGSPHIVTNHLRIPAGVTLTIEPCAEVQFEEDRGIELRDDASALRAEGTAKQPITFRGKDGARWSDVDVSASAQAILRHVTMQGGGSDRFAANATLVVRGDGATPAKHPALVDHVTIDGSLGAGVRVFAAGGFAAGSTDLVITGSGSDDHPYPLEIGEHAIGSLPTGRYTGNRADEILIEDEGANQRSGLQEDATMRDLGVPYHFGTWRDARFRIGGGDEGSLATLTIEKGVTLRFEPGNRFEIEHLTGPFAATGALRALGTADAPVVFTSAAPSPASGDWGGLWFGGIPRAENHLEHVRIEYAGGPCGCVLVSCNAVESYDAAVIFTQPPPSAFITSSTIAHSAGHGIVRAWVDAEGPDFSAGNTFEDLHGCAQTLPSGSVAGSCPSPKPACPQ
jgi:hypothetical protein